MMIDNSGSLLRHVSHAKSLVDKRKTTTMSLLETHLEQIELCSLTILDLPYEAYVVAHSI